MEDEQSAIAEHLFTKYAGWRDLSLPQMLDDECVRTIFAAFNGHSMDLCSRWRGSIPACPRRADLDKAKATAIVIDRGSFHQRCPCRADDSAGGSPFKCCARCISAFCQLHVRSSVPQHLPIVARFMCNSEHIGDGGSQDPRPLDRRHLVCRSEVLGFPKPPSLSHPSPYFMLHGSPLSFRRQVARLD